jgi:undecaprenyl-diphosphatase
MLPKYHATLFTLLIGLTLSGFTLISILIKGNHIDHFDHAIITFVQNFETSTLTNLMLFFTEVGSGSSIHIFAFIIFILFYFFLKYRVELLLFIIVLLSSHYLFRALKHMFQRSRPDLNRLVEIGGYSFPSGHATNAICIYGILTFVLWRHIPSLAGRFPAISIYLHDFGHWN